VATNLLDLWPQTPGEAASATSNGSQPGEKADLTDWRAIVLAELRAFHERVGRDYEKARRRSSRQAWSTQWAGKGVTAGSAGIGSVMAAVGSGVIQTNTVVGWVLVVIGVVFAMLGAVIPASNYVQNRNKMLRFLRLGKDVFDWTWLVLPTAEKQAAYDQLDQFRSMWESAGN
jgi:hypothetical protein